MKGQIFITVSIFVAIAILMISTILSDVRDQPADYLQDYFTNIKSEITSTTSRAILDGTDIATSIDEYSKFSNSILSEKGYKQDISYKIDLSKVTVNVYLGRGEEYYSEVLVIDRGVYT